MTDEIEIVRRTTLRVAEQLGAVVSTEDILAVQQLVIAAPVSDHVIDYAVRLAAATRPAIPQAPQVTRDFVEWGAGPRASQYLILGAKALALARRQSRGRNRRRARGGAARLATSRDHELPRDRRRQEVARHRDGAGRAGAGEELLSDEIARCQLDS